MKTLHIILLLCAACLIVPGHLSARKKIKKDHPLVGMWQMVNYDDHKSPHAELGPLFLSLGADGTFQMMMIHEGKGYYTDGGTLSVTSGETCTLHITQSPDPEKANIKIQASYEYNKENQTLLLRWKHPDFEYEVLGLWAKVKPVAPGEWPGETGD